MIEAEIRIPDKLVPVFDGPAQYRGAYGGRGSGKTRSFAMMAAVLGYRCAQAGEPGVIVCGREFQKSLADSSMAEVKGAIEAEPWLAAHYDIGKDYIRTRDGRIEFLFLGLRYNVDSIKSTSRIRLFWADEAEPIPETSWIKIIPSIREDGSEIWVTWNPERKASATNQRFREDKPADSKIIELNWRDNPWFPRALDAIRREDLAKRPEQYDHIWEGAYATVHAGAYYAALLSQAEREGRIARVPADPLMAYRAFWDIGGTGAKSDACAIWIAQFVGREIRWLDYYEAQGQPLAAHVSWLRARGYGPALCVLPHDGRTNDRVYNVSFESALREAGFQVKIVPNQGAGAARMRIEAARRLFPSMWFNRETTEAGREAIGWYHEKKSDDSREIGLGPEHDWCLASGTQVLTPNGWRPIEELSVHDKVLTPCGTRRIMRSGIVRETNKWVMVNGIRCTPEHRFFTSRGLIEAADCLRSQEKFWTQGSWGLRILAFWCAILSLGLKTAIISATPGGKQADADPCSFIGWCMRLCMARCRTAMKCITSMVTRSITTQIILKPFHALPIVANTNHRHVTFASAACAVSSSGAIRSSDRAVAINASERITLASNESVAPAYNLTVERDECYFVRGNDGLAYLVSNSSHSADAFGLACVAYEAPESAPPRLQTRAIVGYGRVKKYA